MELQDVLDVVEAENRVARITLIALLRALPAESKAVANMVISSHRQREHARDETELGLARAARREALLDRAFEPILAALQAPPLPG